MHENQIDEKNELDESQSPSYSIGKSQKLAVGVLAFFALATILLWFIQFKNNLSLSTPAGNTVITDTRQTSSTGELTESELRAMDTDGDGLSDWDELYIYKTSPYLADSDSDGFSDKEEIDAGTDPNCPEGRDCYGTTPVEPDNVIDDLLETSNNSPEAPAPTQEGPKTEGIRELENVMYTDGDVTELRQMLIANGMDKAMLDAISDAELLEVFRETIQGN